MKSTEYLYGIQPDELKGMEYFDALKFKLEKAKDLYFELWKDNKNEERAFWVWNAKMHTEKLLKEIDER